MCGARSRVNLWVVGVSRKGGMWGSLILHPFFMVVESYLFHKGSKVSLCAELLTGLLAVFSVSM